MSIHVIVGTAGHVDHGKTSLVHALTGTHADRLPEEKQRGMTVDLGFALLETDGLRMGIVDVPGHERFIRNMLCGAMGIDVALMVVAATESVKPQTREHLEILSHLGITHGVIALTKCDLVDGEWLALVDEEVRQYLSTTPLGAAPRVRVSTKTGDGIDLLKTQLTHVARQAAEHPRRASTEAPFCMGVDRVFSVDGHGTVVTGSVSSGQLRIGDEVEIVPGELSTRVRGLQSYNRAVSSVQRGQRAALNLASIPREAIRRGNLVAAPGSVTSSRCLCALIDPHADHRHAAARRLTVRMHLATAEASATWRPLEQIPDQGPMLVELRTDLPVAALAGQPLIVRSQCGRRTLGGGRVLVPDFPEATRVTAMDVTHLRRLASPEPRERVAAALYLRGLAGFDETAMGRRCGFQPPPRQLLEPLVSAHLAQQVELGGGRTHVLHRDVLDQWIERAVRLLHRRHRQNPIAAAFSPGLLDPLMDPSAPFGLRDALLQRMHQDGRLVRMPAGVALPDHGPRLSKTQQREYQRILRMHLETPYAPPSTDELVASAHAHREAIPRLVELACAQGHLVRVCDHWCLHWEADRDMRRTLAARFERQPFTVTELKSLLNTSRKYAVPLCEYLDRIGATRREGDLRYWVGADTDHREAS